MVRKPFAFYFYIKQLSLAAPVEKEPVGMLPRFKYGAPAHAPVRKHERRIRLLAQCESVGRRRLRHEIGAGHPGLKIRELRRERGGVGNIEEIQLSLYLSVGNGVKIPFLYAAAARSDPFFIINIKILPAVPGMHGISLPVQQIAYFPDLIFHINSLCIRSRSDTAPIFPRR